MLITQYEVFIMKEGKTIQEMHTKLTTITNELHCLGEDIRPTKHVRKVLSILPKAWESEVNAIIEAKDLKTMNIDELIGNLKTYELKKKQDKARGEHKKERNLVLKSTKQDASVADNETTYITKRFLEIMRRIGELLRRGGSSRYNKDKKANKTCQKCGKLSHFIKDCPLHKIEYKDYVKQSCEREKKKDPIPDKYRKRVVAITP